MATKKKKQDYVRRKADVLLTAEEVCEVLKVRMAWLYRRVRADERFPRPYIIGGAVRFLAREINKYVLTSPRGWVEGASNRRR